MALADLDYVLGTLQLFCLPPKLRNSFSLLKDQAEQAIKSYLHWEVDQQTGQIDYYDGSGRADLALRNPYVSAVTAVYIDPQGAYGQNPAGFPASSQLVVGTDYALVIDSRFGGKSGVIKRITNNASWLWPSDYFYNARVGGLAYTIPAYWPAGVGNIKVVYTWGFAPGSIPLDIQLAVATCVGQLTNTTKYGFPANQESMGSHSISVSITKEPEFGMVRDLLRKYRDTAI